MDLPDAESLAREERPKRNTTERLPRGCALWPTWSHWRASAAIYNGWRKSMMK